MVIVTYSFRMSVFLSASLSQISLSMGVIMIFKYGKRFRFAPSFNNTKRLAFPFY